MRRRLIRPILTALLPLLGHASISVGQTPPPDTLPGVRAVAEVSPDTVTVGEHFIVRIGVAAPGAAAVRFPPFTLVEPVEAADSLRLERDSSGMWVASYRLAAWSPSDSLVGRFPFRITRSDGSREDRVVRVRLPVVASVLPADSSLHRPRPARALLPIATPATNGRGWLLPAILLAVLLALAAALALRARRPHPIDSADPRMEALRALSVIEAESLPESGAAELYFVRTSRVLRHYLAVACALGEDLATSELLRHPAGRHLPPEATEDLERLLRAADRVKFSGDRGAADPLTARTYGTALRAWVERWPAESSTEERVEAA